jgi:hypothetical protein
MGFAPSVDSLGAERLANHGMELRTPLITAPSGRYQGAPALIPAVRWRAQSRFICVFFPFVPSPYVGAS